MTIDRIADEYESAAEWCAKRGIQGADGDPLPALLSADAWESINTDTSAFRARVADYAYAIHMNALKLPE